MEVKIKIGDEIIDAKIVMMNGDMVVSLKVEKFKPKDGDVLSSFFNGKYQGTFVFEEASECGEAISHFALNADGVLIKGNGCNYFGYIYDVRPATKKEKQKLFDRLKEEGWEWDAEKKELVKLKWKPKAGQSYYIPIICNDKFKAIIEGWSDDSMDALYLDKGWCFKTKEECQAFCDKLNKAIEGVKP